MTRRLDGSTINLKEAIALLSRNQAAFVSEMAERNKRREEMAAQSEHRFVASERRFAGIEPELHEIRHVLLDLPETIRQKIGFKAR